MRLRDVIKAEKQDIHLGEWKTGKIPRSAFPLSKAKGKAYRQGPGISWRVITFRVGDRAFKLLVKINEAKEQFEAKLGMEVGKDLAILCSLEFHGTEPGWHCHLCCDPVTSVPTGVQRGPWVQRIPGGGSFHRRKSFDVSRKSAATFAAKFYRVRGRRGLL